MARGIAKLAMDGLDDEIRGEEVRRAETSKSGTLKRMRLDPAWLVQRLVLETATHFLDVLLNLSDGDEALERFHILYLELLVEHALRHNSFDANVAVNGFVYDFSAPEIVLFHTLLTGDHHQRDEVQVAKRRRQVLQRLELKLEGRVGFEAGPHGQRRLVADEGIDQERIEKILSALVPWDARCVFLDDVDRSENLLPHLPDLHSDFMALSHEEDPQLEINRVFAVVEPVVHQRFSRMVDERLSELRGVEQKLLERKLRIPKLFSAGRSADFEEPGE